MQRSHGLGVRRRHVKVDVEGELVWTQEVHQSHELFDVVLQRRARDEELAGGVEAHEHLVELSLRVFETVGLVDGEELPLDGLQLVGVLENVLVRGDEDVEPQLLGWAELVVADHRARLGVADVAHDVEVRRPDLELFDPGRERREGDDDEVGAVLVHRVDEVRDEADTLDCLAQSHLVCENAILSLRPKVGEPVEAGDLKLLELAARREVAWLLAARVKGGEDVSVTRLRRCSRSLTGTHDIRTYLGRL